MADLTVRDLMTANPKTVDPMESLEVARELFYEHDIRHLPVVDDDGELLGLITHRDLLRHVFSEQLDMPVSLRQDILRQTRVGGIMIEQVTTAESGDDVAEAAQTMFEHKFGCLPVVEGRQLVGILTESDFVRYFAEGR